MKIKKIFKNLSYSVIANGTNTLVSMILVLFVPKILSVREYSYWQLYLFYASYVGFFHFGWADGIYLRFGGKKYEELDKKYFHMQFCLLSIFEVFVAVIFCGISFFMPDVNKQVVIRAVGICCVLQLPRTLLQYLLQTTNRITDYAKNYLFEKIIYAILVVVALAAGIRQFEILVLADLVARLVTLILLIRECKDIVLIKIEHLFDGLKEAWVNVNVGIKLMFANIASQLLIGIVRWAIQNKWSVETFGKVSLSITASNLLMVFISAVSVVLYPLLKDINPEKYVEIYTKIRTILMVVVLGMLIVYYPAKVILSWWLPQYAESLKYMALLFPMCVFESKMTMLINTYLKALREEKAIMLINWAVVIITIISTAIFVYGMGNLLFAIVSLTFLIGTRCSIGELYLAKTLGFSPIKDIIYEWLMVIVFMFVSWKIDSWLSFVIYAVVYLIYMLVKRGEVKEVISMVKKSV